MTSGKVLVFTPTPEQLHEGITHICYEYTNLISAAHWDMRVPPDPWRTHADDAFLLGCRKLGDFLINSYRSKRAGQELPDILAIDYLPQGVVPNWDVPVWRGEWRDAMDRQLAHLSYVRNKRWNHGDWVPKLEKEFRAAWREFMTAIDPAYKDRFFKELKRSQHSGTEL